MPNILFQKTPDTLTKLRLMQEDAKYDVADNDDYSIPDMSSICDEIKAPQAPPKVPKVFLSNDCIFNCAYCGCRSTRDCKTTYAMQPRELAELSVTQARQSKAGIFLTSAIYRHPDYTEELIIETMRIIRRELGYRGYLHAKVMPGTSKELIFKAGQYANRLSVNIEVARQEGYSMVAKNKNIHNILTPMRQISHMIRAAQDEGSSFRPRFATSQSTQLMAGSSGEDDRTILRLSNTLYQKYHLKRVYYTSFTYRHKAKGYDELPAANTPQWRMRRLYQADRLMQLYGFTPDEITPDDSPFLEADIDPKAAWALRHLDLYPIEVSTADYEMLIRIPGIGVTLAQRIIKARRYCTLTPDVLHSLGVSLKRSQHFITCNGRYSGLSCENDVIVRQLLADEIYDSLLAASI